MGILAFLVILCCLSLIAWGFGIFRSSTSTQKHQSKSQPPQHLPPKGLEPQKRDTVTLAKPTLPQLPLQNKIISTSNRVIVPRQSPAFKKSRNQATNKHQLNIRYGDRVLQRLRSEATEVELPMVLATLRQMNPYAFEELLLTCCQDQGWQIQRNFRYSNDGGVDGRITIKGKLYLIQAKRYTGHIKPEHIRNFHNVIHQEKAAGGFFIHSGKTGQISKELLREFGINLISVQRLVNFVLGRQVKILGTTIPISKQRDNN